MDVLHQKRTVLLRRQLQQVTVAVIDREEKLLTVADDLDDGIARGHTLRVAVKGDIRIFIIRRHARSRGADGLVFLCFVHAFSLPTGQLKIME